MSWIAEPELDHMLSDPLILSVMERDHVDLDRLRALLREIGGTLARQSIANDDSRTSRE